MTGDWHRTRAGEIFSGWALDEKPYRLGDSREILDQVRSSLPDDATADDLRGVLHELAEIATNWAHVRMGEAQEMNKLAARLEQAVEQFSFRPRTEGRPK